MKKEVSKAFTKTRQLWILACNFDEILPDSHFVVWSIGNPYTKEYNKAMKNFLDLKDKQKGKI